MSFSSRCCRIFSARVARVIANCGAVPRIVRHDIPRQDVTLPCAIGFSLLTLLGFEKKLSAEDELINTIKHCILFIQRAEYVKAEQLLHVALRQAQQMQHKLGITYIYDVMANLALEREQLDKAKTLFISVSQRLMADGATEDDARIVHISVKLARISHLQKEHNTAQLGYDWCLKKLKDSYSRDPNDDTKKVLALTEDWYGRLFLDCAQFEHGYKLMLSALNRMREVRDVEPGDIVQQINDIGAVCVELGKVDESIDYFKQAIELGNTVPGYDSLGTLYINLGRAFIKKNLIEEARKSCGYGWKLAHMGKSVQIQKEAELCLNEIKNLI